MLGMVRIHLSHVEEADPITRQAVRSVHDHDWVMAETVS